ncbi:MAG: zinc ribbon domain-containing protein [Acutalibacteraceae bacterium]
MFCEKCGNKMNDGEIFCQKCGTKISDELIQAQQPVVQQPVTQQAPVQTAYTYNQQTAPSAPKAPRKPIPKKFILGGAIGAGVIAIACIVIFVILPMFNKADLSKFIRVDFDEDMLYEDLANATVSFDEKELTYAFITDGKTEEDYKNSLSGGDYSDMLNSLQSQLGGKAVGLSTILDNCKINAYIKGDENATEETTEDEGIGSSSGSSNKTYLEKLSSKDVIVVELIWDKDQESQRDVERAEKAMGVNFDKTDKTVELSVSNELKKDDLTLKETQKVDVLDYIEKNKLTTTKGFKDGELAFSISDFEFDAGDYKIVYNRSDSYDIQIKKGDEYVGYIDVKLMEKGSEDYSSYNVNKLSANDVVTVSLNRDYIEGTNLVIATQEKDFTVTPNTPITLEEAKSNTEAIKKAVTEYIEKNSSTLKNPSVVNAYLITPVDASKSNWENKILVFVQGKYEGWFSSYDKYFMTYDVSDAYINNGNLEYDYITSGSGNKELSTLTKNNYYFTTPKGYKSEKIM